MKPPSIPSASLKWDHHYIWCHWRNSEKMCGERMKVIMQCCSHQIHFHLKLVKLLLCHCAIFLISTSLLEIPECTILLHAHFNPWQSNRRLKYLICCVKKSEIFNGYDCKNCGRTCVIIAGNMITDYSRCTVQNCIRYGVRRL